MGDRLTVSQRTREAAEKMLADAKGGQITMKAGTVLVVTRVLTPIERVASRYEFEIEVEKAPDWSWR